MAMSLPLVEDPPPPYELVPLRKSYPALHGAPTISQVDVRIFRLTYFERCMACTTCADWCCSFGVAVDLANVKRIREHEATLAPFVVGKPHEWFDDTPVEETDFAGGRADDTQVIDDACAFRSKTGRGCGIHAYTIARGIDYHELKPLYCSLFPLTCDDGWLVPSCEIDEASLVCLGPGSSLYRGVRDELLHYFGAELVAELDAIEQASVR